MFQGSGGRSAWNDPDDAEEIKDLFETLRDQIDRVVKKVGFNADDVNFAAELTARISRMGRIAIEEYASEKQRDGRLDFDDLLLLARDLLVNSPTVAEHLAAGIRLLMVDEFQDTDPVQAEIIRRLVGPALKTGKLFLVGDDKQSIYRFHRADPKIFEELKNEVPKQIPLQVNFRSQPEILNFVDHLFAGKYKEAARLTPHPDKQLSPPPTIEFLWATRNIKPSPNSSPKPNAEELRAREAAWITARISELLAEGQRIIRDEDHPGELRPVKLRDIAILFRTLSNAAIYEAALADLGIDYYLVGGKTFFAQQEVFDLLNLCRWLDDPADEIPLVGILRSPFFNLSDDAIFALKLANPSLGTAWLKPRRRIYRNTTGNEFDSRVACCQSCGGIKTACRRRNYCKPPSTEPAMTQRCCTNISVHARWRTSISCCGARPNSMTRNISRSAITSGSWSKRSKIRPTKRSRPRCRKRETSSG